MEFGEMKRNTSNWSNFGMLLRRAGLTASAGLSCPSCVAAVSTMLLALHQTLNFQSVFTHNEIIKFYTKLNLYWTINAALQTVHSLLQKNAETAQIVCSNSVFKNES